MAILIHVEVSSRELDSKLLLAVLSASRGYDVIVGDVIMAARLNLFPKSIFHTKNISPTKKIVDRHQQLVDHGHIVTSLDEEGPGVEYEVEEGYLERFSEKTINQSQAVFCWGTDEYQALVSRFPHHSSKIFLSGSPRADLWQPRFRNHGRRPTGLPEDPFVLVSSNMGPARVSPVAILSDRSEMQSLSRETILNHLELLSQNFRMLAAFVRAIEHLAKALDRGLIVVRPHPGESVDAWKNLLDGIPRVLVIREGSISEWLDDAVAVIHNGCTTGIEATIAGQRLISYTPFEQDFLLLPNDLGSRAHDFDQLVECVRIAFQDHASELPNSSSARDREVIRRKVLWTEEELASERILSVWEGLGQKNATPRSRLLVLRLLLILKQIWHALAKAAVGSKVDKQRVETDKKFPPIDRHDVKEKVKDLTEILSLDCSIDMEFVGPKTIFFRASKPQSGPVTAAGQ